MAGNVQIDAAVRAAAMNSFSGLLAARSEGDAVWGWSPVSWEGMNLREAHAVVVRAIGTRGTGHACCVGTLVKVCPPAEAGGRIDVAKS